MKTMTMLLQSRCRERAGNANLCEGDGVKPYPSSWILGVCLLLLAFCAGAVGTQETNAPASATNLPNNVVSAAVTNLDGAPGTNAAMTSRASDSRPGESGRDRSREERNTTREGSGSQWADYSAFRLIAERNIFNANRSGRRPTTTATSSRPRTVRVETFGLVGTMSYEQGDFAFFDGTSSQFRRVLKPSDSIAGYKLAAITGNWVKLEADGKEIQLKVGAQMRREDEGQWQLSSRTESFAATPGGEVAAGATASAGSNGTGAPAGEVSDVLKRLMQQREQEENK